MACIGRVVYSMHLHSDPFVYQQQLIKLHSAECVFVVLYCTRGYSGVTVFGCLILSCCCGGDVDRLQQESGWIVFHLPCHCMGANGSYDYVQWRMSLQTSSCPCLVVAQ